MVSMILHFQYIFTSPPSARVIYPGNSVAYVPDHTDIQYNSFLKSSSSDHFDFLTCWVPLQGVPEVHGGLHVYPGSFAKSPTSSKTPLRGWISDKFSSLQSEKYVVDYSLGDVVIFVPELVHGSSPNNSLDMTPENFRISMDFRVFSSFTKTSRHYLHLQSLKTYSPGEGPCGSNYSSGNWYCFPGTGYSQEPCCT